MKLFGRTKGKINKDKSGKNVPYLEFPVLIHCKIVNNDYQEV